MAGCARKPSASQGEKLLAQGQPEQAAVAYRKQLAENPDDKRAAVGLGLAHRMAGNWKAAIESLTAAKKLAPGDAMVRVALVHSLTLAGRLDDARTEASALTTKFSGAASGYLLFAALADNTDRIAEARLGLERFRGQQLAGSEGEPGAEVELTLAELARREQRPDVAAQLLSETRDKPLMNPAGSVELARLYRGIGRDVAARDFLHAAFRGTPSHAPAAPLLAQVAEESHAPELALEALEALPPKARAKPRMKLVEGRVLTQLGKPQEAIALLTGALAAKPQDSGLVVDLALSLASAIGATEDTAAAGATLEAIDTSKANPPQRLAAARLWIKLGHPAQARGLLAELLEEPELGEVARTLSIEGLLDEGRGREALKQANAFAKARPGDAQMGFLLALSERATGQGVAAQRTLHDVLKGNPEHLSSVRLAVELATGSGGSAAAQNVLEDVTKRAPKAAPLRRFAARYYTKIARYGRAEKHLEAWRNLQPWANEPRIRLARVKQKSGDPLAALMLFRGALQREPNNRLLLLESAQAEATVGDRDVAIELYEKLISEKPDDLSLLNNLAFLYADEGAPLDRAEEYARKALAQKPDSPTIKDTLGWVLSRAGKHAEAIRLLREAVGARAQSPSVHYHLGAALLAAGQPVDGRSYLRKALALSKTFREAELATKLLAGPRAPKTAAGSGGAKRGDPSPGDSAAKSAPSAQPSAANK